MSEHDDEISMGGLLEQFRDGLQEELHTALPGRVESYDPAAQTADVMPMIRAAIPRRDGGVLREDLPTIRAVPVVHPRWGSWFVHAPLAAGDFVLLVVLERDLARWRQTGQLADPLDRRAHHLSHAVAIPGLYPRTQNLDPSNTPSAAMVIGRDVVDGETGPTIRILQSNVIEVHAPTIRLGGASADAEVALEPALAQHLDAIAADLTTIQTAIEAITGPGSLPLTYDTLGKATLDGTAPIASSKVVAE